MEALGSGRVSERETLVSHELVHSSARQAVLRFIRFHSVRGGIDEASQRKLRDVKLYLDHVITCFYQIVPPVIGAHDYHDLPYQ